MAGYVVSADGTRNTTHKDLADMLTSEREVYAATLCRNPTSKDKVSVRKTVLVKQVNPSLVDGLRLADDDDGRKTPRHEKHPPR